MGGASDTLAWSCLALPFSKRTDTIKWGKSNKQHRATSRRSRTGIRANRTVSTRGCWKWAVLIRGGALCRWTAPQDAIVCWRRSIVRRARRMPTPDVATPLSHATPSRPSSSFCLFSLPSASCLNFSSERHPSRISRGPLCPRYIRRINVRTPETKRQGTTAHHGAEDTERKDKRKTRHWKVRVSSR
ncbi:uncharacterized protein LOC105735541 isoform X1 [Apis florea]|uniref:uncharacterized protein LOC105735541 isoform X1 n=1 Tax=Apis florea TaxID=7463 RepID=UPI0012FF0C9F|nr:uncharacterized protein LOC105735541 isoform X1 [Apis florea]